MRQSPGGEAVSDPYEKFLAQKLVTAPLHGFEADDISEVLFPWQREVVRWALRVGRGAVFLDTGLGKTLVQLEWARHIPGPVLILAPLAVAGQTVREAAKLGLPITYARSQADVTERVTITNYEMLVAFDPGYFEGVVLDESSILKTFTGATKRALLEAFGETPYRLACTATPAPNDHMELGNHAAFLGVMASNEMLARWFINDSMKAGNYRLKRHGEDDFWRWVASWAVCATKPSDLGDYSDEGYILPPLELAFHTVSDPGRAHAAGKLFLGDSNLSATDMWRDKGETAEDRCVMTAKIVSESPGTWLVWCETNKESELLADLIPGAVEVRGSESVEAKERKLLGFAAGDFPILVTKGSIAGLGLNYQHCHQVVFAGLTYSWERLYQSIRRCWRFRQTEPVTAHLVSAESDVGILETLWRKKADHEEMQQRMVAATRRHGFLGERDRELTHTTDLTTFEGPGWRLILGDNMRSLRQMPSDSVGLSVWSPPFEDLYIYGDDLADWGNSTLEEFYEHLAYMLPELYRVTMPGRLSCVHCKDLPLYRNRDGDFGLRDFPGLLIRAFEAAGWTYHSRVTIWKDPVTEMQRTKTHGLLHKNFTERGEVVRQGMADYLLVFGARRDKGEVPDKQIRRRLTRDVPYIGDDPGIMAKDDRDYSIQTWQRYASPVWFDIRQQRVLAFRGARDAEDERHICPLQLDVVERCIWLWSNPGDLVLDPCAGIGSVPYCAVTLDREGLGLELKESYVSEARRNLELAVAQRAQGSML